MEDKKHRKYGNDEIKMKLDIYQRTLQTLNIVTLTENYLELKKENSSVENSLEGVRKAMNEDHSKYEESVNKLTGALENTSAMLVDIVREMSVIKNQLTNIKEASQKETAEINQLKQEVKNLREQWKEKDTETTPSSKDQTNEKEQHTNQNFNYKKLHELMKSDRTRRTSSSHPTPNKYYQSYNKLHQNTSSRSWAQDINYFNNKPVRLKGINSTKESVEKRDENFNENVDYPNKIQSSVQRTTDRENHLKQTDSNPEARDNKMNNNGADQTAGDQIHNSEASNKKNKFSSFLSRLTGDER